MLTRYVRVPGNMAAPASFWRYYEELRPKLREIGVECSSVNSPGNVYWNPFGGWAEPPEDTGPRAASSFVTFHGGAAFSKPLIEVFGTYELAAEKQSFVEQCLARWSQAAKRFQGVIVPSAYSASEFESVFQYPRQRIHVIPHGVNKELFSSVGRTRKNVGFLHVSSGGPVKNVALLVEAYASLPLKIRPNLTLIIPPAAYVDWMTHIEGVRFISSPLATTELAAFYRGAIALINPSLWETFAMTIIEAMACGCPVLAGNNSAMRENYAGAALLVDARSRAAIAEGMGMLLNNEYRSSLQRSGQECAKRFSWKRVATEHLRILFGASEGTRLSEEFA